MTLTETASRAGPSSTLADSTSPCVRVNQAKIHWALSFMKSGCTALHANHILWREASEALPAFISWKGFELDFISFCLKNEAIVALTNVMNMIQNHVQG